jgi:hypothetical protein
LNELYGNLWNAVAGYIQSWILPSAIGVGFFALALLPSVEDQSPWSELNGADAGGDALLFAFATLFVSVALAVSARPLLRLLEGYTLRPQWLKERWIEVQRAQRMRLRRQIGEVTSLQDKAQLREKLNQFPRDASWVLPTRLGNALRAGETYGDSQYGLSTVGLWTRLVAVVDGKVTDQLAQSRAVLDFFIAMMALSAALVAATVLVAVWAGEILLVLWVLLLVGLMPLWYGRAVAAVGWYAQAMEALADLGRLPLAEKLGMRLPGDVAAERELWRAVSNYAAWGSNWETTTEWIARIDEALVERGAAAAQSADQPSPEAHGSGGISASTDCDQTSDTAGLR